jgi:hypothetical protein
MAKQPTGWDEGSMDASLGPLKDKENEATEFLQSNMNPSQHMGDGSEHMGAMPPMKASDKPAKSKGKRK